MKERWRVKIKYLDIWISFDFDNFEVASCFAREALVHAEMFIQVELERKSIDLEKKDDLSFAKMLEEDVGVLHENDID